MANGSNWLGLTGRVCVVTGAASGIGQATARSLAEVGAHVALLDINVDGASATAAELASAGARVVAVRCDTTSEASIAEAHETVRKTLGPADALVNNAGVLRPGGLDTLSLADWNALLAVNLTGYFLTARTFGKDMREHGRGAMVHIASIAATQPQAFSGAYSVSKAGVAMLSRQLSVEWGPSGVRSNVVSPGFIRTPLSEAFYQVPGVEESRARIVPSGRVGLAEDIAKAVTYLVSDKAEYINGEEILVDGGASNILMSQVPRPGYERPS